MAPTQMITPTQGEIPSKLHKPQSSIRLLRLRCIKWSAATIHLPQSTLPNLTKRTRELLRPSPARPVCSYVTFGPAKAGKTDIVEPDWLGPRDRQLTVLPCSITRHYANQTFAELRPIVLILPAPRRTPGSELPSRSWATLPRLNLCLVPCRNAASARASAALARRADRVGGQRDAMRQKLKTLRIRKLMDERPEGFGLLRRTPARVQQWADAAAADKAAAAADAATAANSAAEKRRGGGLFTIWQYAGAYRRIAAHQRCGRCAHREPWGHTPGLFHWRPGKTMPVFGNSFPFWFHGTFLFGRGSVLIPKPLS